MAEITDHNFINAWQNHELGLAPGNRYRFRLDIGAIKAGEQLRFLGFNAVDNHHGVFVFRRENGESVELRGDYASNTHWAFLALKEALAAE
ncbi:MAG: hypothetical protein LAT63_08230 [Marinobacter sp.]|nr:hypothetical protein [Marinobacter sp.]